MVNATYDATGTLLNYPDPLDETVVNTYNGGDMAWILVSAVLVMIMSPGAAYLYSGLLRRKNALSMLFLGLAVYCVAAIQWFFWGYSLTFSDTASAFIGDLRYFGLRNVDIQPSIGSTKIPALLFCLYQSMFACITAVLAMGGFAERTRILPILVVTFCWLTVVYNPVACWTWNANGWGYIHGDLDFAGGGPVHITSGTAGLAFSLFLGKRRGYGTEKLAYRPHSVSHVVLGTTLLWFGWFGFNGGSELALNLRSVQASMVTNVAAAMGGLTWCGLDVIYTGKFSAVSLCSGIVAGLVGITPAAGFVGTPSALAIGFLTAIAANYATGLKNILRIDDAVDGFALHGVGGFVGSFLTGIFADSRVASFDGYTEITGGWINKNYEQLGWQLASSTTIMAYTFVVSYLLCFLINFIPGLHFRATGDAEVLGIDEVLHGETSYDFVFSNRDLENPQDFHDFSAKAADAGHVGYNPHASHASSKEKFARHTSSHQPVGEGESA